MVVVSGPLCEYLLFFLGDTHAPLSLSIYVFPSSTLAWREAWDFWRVNTFGQVAGRWQVIGLGSMSGQLQTSVTFLITLTKYVREITRGRRDLFWLIVSVHHIEEGRETLWSFQQWDHVMEESCIMVMNWEAENSRQNQKWRQSSRCRSKYNLRVTYLWHVRPHSTETTP